MQRSCASQKCNKKDAATEQPMKRVDNREASLDNHEQYSKRNSLRLFGLVELEHDGTAQCTIDGLSEAMGPPLCPPLRLGEVDWIHRIEPKDKSARPVLIKFARYAKYRRSK